MQITGPSTLVDTTHNSANSQRHPPFKQDLRKPPYPLPIKMAREVENGGIDLTPHNSLWIGDNILIDGGVLKLGNECGEFQSGPV